MFLTAGGDPGRIGGAKKILTATVIGLVIILAAWLIVDTVITFLTPASSPFQNWSTIDCPVCGDGNCDSGETSESCSADCGAPPSCSWQNGACYQSPCADPTPRYQLCGPVGCSGNCDGQSEGDTQCIADPGCAAPVCPPCIICP